MIVDKLKDRSESSLAIMLLAMALFAPMLWAQEAPMMDGMGNINAAAKKANAPAEALYKSHCAECHDKPVGRVPPRAALRYRPAEGVYQALVSGPMAPMAEGLKDDQIKSLVKLLTGREPREVADPSANLCTNKLDPVVVADADWVSTHGDIQGHRFRNVDAITSKSVERLKLKWSYAYPGGASGPVTVAGNTLFLAGTGYVVALSAESGCARWVHSTDGRIVRTITIADYANADDSHKDLPASVALFGDDSGTVYALDASTGDELWQTNVENNMLSRITSAPTVYDGVAYVPISSIEDPLTHDKNHVCCTSRGGVAALELSTGKQLWKQHNIEAPAKPIKQKYHTEVFTEGPSGAATYTPLTIDTKRGVVYATTAEEYGFTNLPGPYSVIAYDLKTGKRAWQQAFLPEPKERKRICDTRETDCRNFFSMGTSALLHSLSPEKDILVVGQKSGLVYGLDPDAGGKVLWTIQVAEGGDLGGVMYSLASNGKNIFVPIADVDSPAEPSLTGSTVALDPANGDIVWRSDTPKPACNWDDKTCIAGQVAGVTVVSDMLFSGFWDGYLRIYAANDGRLLRAIDTAREYKAVNGVASGGQVSGYPVTVAKDAIYITSGSSSVVKSGNALLVYTLEGK